MADFDYTKLTDQDFDRLLISILDKMSGEQILAVPGVYEAVSEHFNNEVLELWEREHPEAARKEQ